MKFYLVYKNNGLYDPILDDTEIVYEPIDPDDFDQSSHPTEVFTPIQDLQFPVQEYCDNKLEEFSGSRSITASPFLLSTKPYRPFSTDPTPVPPLEDPIILNPDYSDVFNELGIDEGLLPETRFKLPISEQYDPDGKKAKGESVCKEVVSKNVVSKDIVSKKVVSNESVSVRTTESHEETLSKEVKFDEKMRREIDLEKIELTATDVVDNSIEKAVTVAEEIKREIDVELRELSVELEQRELKSLQSNIKLEDSVKESIEQHSEVNVAREVVKIESNKQQDQSVVERKLSTKQDIEESIVVGSVKSKSEKFDSESATNTQTMKQVVEYITNKNEIIRKSENKVEKDTQRKSSIDGSTQTVETQRNILKSDTKHDSKTTTESKTSKDRNISTAKLLAEQRSYTIGLQTIPHIKGNVHSSYHYNLLLKTFFIHLTDVMVALSRFILTEPVLDKEQEETKVNTESNVKNVYNEVVDIQKTQKIEKLNKQSVEKYIHDQTININNQAESKTVDKRKSGLEMAQRTDKKSEEVTQKMDAVITEFQNKTSIDESVLLKEEVSEQRDRRSRSRSKIEEEVSQESDPLVWLSKHEDSTTTKVPELKTVSSEIHKDTTDVQKIQEHEKSNRKSKDDKNVYIAIVESHVYTNKDYLLNEVEMSETSSVQSAEDANIAIETKTNEQAALTSCVSNVAGTITHNDHEIKEAVEIIEDALINKVGIHKLHEVTQYTVENNEKSTMDVNKTLQTISNISEKHTISSNFEEIKQTSSVSAESTIEIQTALESEPLTTVADDIETVEVVEIKEEQVIPTQEVIVSITDSQEEKVSSEVVTQNEIATVASEFKHETAEHVSIIEAEEIITNNVEQIAIEDKSTVKDESANLKIVKEQITDIQETVQINNETEIMIKEQIEIDQSSKITSNSHIINEEHVITSQVQESSFTATLSEFNNIESRKSLHLDLNQNSNYIDSPLSAESTDIATPTPSTYPPTPLTDEYVFKLQIPLPKTAGVPRDPSPVPEEDDDHEDPHIVKKNLVPHIETSIGERILYDPPLASPPPNGTLGSPVYTKPGLRGGGSMRNLFRKEEILEIERKSSLLASAIDETIKSIEEYKEEVGLESISKNNDSPPIVYNGYAKVIQTKVYENTNTESIENHIKNNQAIIKLSKNIANEASEIVQKRKIMKENQKKTKEAMAKAGQIKAFEANTSAQDHNEIITVNGHDERLAKKTITNNVILDSSITTDSKTPVIIPVMENNTRPIQDLPANIEVRTNGQETQSANIDVFIPRNEEAEKVDPMLGYRPVPFDPEEIAQNMAKHVVSNEQVQITVETPKPYVSETGEILGTHQGIVDGLLEATVDEEVEKELGKPGMTDVKIAELISGESEMLREAHVMGLSRVIKSHMTKDDDDSSVDFKKIKPILESLKDSEVLRALNDELTKTKQEKKTEERKWTKFLQKPARPVPASSHAYGFMPQENLEEPYKVKIVKQPKPKIAPDYKPEDFETGPLPWEERARNEPPPPPVEAEDPILVPEEIPEFYEAVDPLPESEVPDLEDSGIPLPPPKSEEEETVVEPTEEIEKEEDIKEEVEGDPVKEVLEEETEKKDDMGDNNLTEQLMLNVQRMVDPNASLDQQLAQMRAQLAALAQLPCVIQQTLECVTKQLSQLTQQESQQLVVSQRDTQEDDSQEIEVVQNDGEVIEEETQEQLQLEDNQVTIVEVIDTPVVERKPTLNPEELEQLRQEEKEVLDEQRRIEKQKKELMDQLQQESESRQIKQRPTPRVGKPAPMFGPLTPQERPLVLPGGRKWRKPKDAYNDQYFTDILSSQAELIQGKTKGMPYESVLLPYDERINFLKYEKPPVSLDHLQNSDVYKLIHNLDQEPGRRVDMLTPVIAEADYREKCRSVTPYMNGAHQNIPEQVQP